MCWCAEVSAAFAALEWTGIMWLIRRNEPLDRPFALALSPIAAQEALQWLLWEHISLQSAECDRLNLIGSLLIRQITGVVPLAWVWFAQHASPQRRIARLLLGLTTAFVALRNAMIIHSFYVFPPLCTTIGPGHHQAWPPYLGRHVHLQPHLDIIFFSLYWMLPVGALLYLFRPRWLGRFMCALIIATMVPCLLMFTADELGSVWCWSCSTLLAIALFYPRIARKLAKTP
ncbi:MAG TPA: hypothetical protein PK156_39950 [Polyangium sp.]|nr:hypothetical protein [Polyangium sp.]